ncbi:MAG: bifunctional demethylmenaquinone methyltransferase/2-methoxy-6-polyprenyl-1,4-benzoquinol methylase UbiE [Desulfuromonadales bacterium]|nr:bifunctional demethylmenaquinone methyltransferase/2-methoxy-6-polyprenyl-1,4-benzoquinol methylase UbiE [Desulfuromonadales bacterium]
MFKLSNKGEHIREMFDSIAPNYDFLNRVLSFGVDQHWRKFAVNQIVYENNGKILDVATGTGDVALKIAAATPETVTITGIDFSPQMIELGREKIARSKYASRISMAVAPCEEIPFSDNTFDSATIAFGIRNVVDRLKGVKEMGRVLKKEGRIVILEFSNPKSKLFRKIYNFYFLKILPKIGGMFSKLSAYKYLPDSVLEFPDQGQFKELIKEAGFKNVLHYDLTFGIATVYVGEKE